VVLADRSRVGKCPTRDVMSAKPLESPW